MAVRYDIDTGCTDRRCPFRERVHEIGRCDLEHRLTGNGTALFVGGRSTEDTRRLVARRQGPGSARRSRKLEEIRGRGSPPMDGASP